MSCGFPKGKEALKFRLDETGKNKKKKGGGWVCDFSIYSKVLFYITCKSYCSRIISIYFAATNVSAFSHLISWPK